LPRWDQVKQRANGSFGQYPAPAPSRWKKLATHDEAIAAMLSAIRELMNPPPPKRRPIGFTADL
jgi:hypothetical protein